MLNSCSAARVTTTIRDQVPVFKMPTHPPELKQAWIRALRRDNIGDM